MKRNAGHIHEFSADVVGDGSHPSSNSRMLTIQIADETEGKSLKVNGDHMFLYDVDRDHLLVAVHREHFVELAKLPADDTPQQCFMTAEGYVRRLKETERSDAAAFIEELIELAYGGIVRYLRSVDSEAQA